jgi:hypothetical protein
MAKRAAPDEQPFRPLLDAGLVSAAIANQATQGVSTSQNAAQKVVDLPRSETIRRIESHRTESPDAQPKEFGGGTRERGPQPRLEKFDNEKRILFTESETHSIDRLVNNLATRLKSQIKVSHLVRAIVALLLNAQGEIDKRAGEAEPLVRPPNGDSQAMQRFERQIAAIIGAALRDAGPIR